MAELGCVSRNVPDSSDFRPSVPVSHGNQLVEKWDHPGSFTEGGALGRGSRAHVLGSGSATWQVSLPGPRDCGLNQVQGPQADSVP